MTTIALEVIAGMIKIGDLGPIHRGEFRKEHCTDAGSESLYDFLSNYRRITEGQGRIPSMAVIKERFPHLALPEVPENVDIQGLVYEARIFKSKLRVQTLVDKMVSAMEAADPISELRTVRSEFDEIMREASSSRDMDFAKVAMEILGDYEAKDILKQGIMWPWPSLNKATSGMHRGEFYIIAGRPKSRKTFVALFIAAFLVRICKLKVLFISPEMPPKQVMLRFMAFLAEVHYTEFKRGELSANEEFELYNIIMYLHDAMNGIVESMNDDQSEFIQDASEIAAHEGGFIVTQATGQSVGYIEAKIKEHCPDIVIVDSFYRLGLTGARNYDTDWKVITGVSRHLKDIAMEHNVVLIGTHQLNREAEDKVGSLANLGYSDAFAQDCDLALRVITAKRKAGDKSALYVLGGRETDCEGVIIHNEPCNNFSEIEPITPGSKSKLLSMLASEEELEKAEQEKKQGTPPKNVRAGLQKRLEANKQPTNTGLPAAKIVNPVRPEDLPDAVEAPTPEAEG